MRFVLYTHSLLSDWNHGNAHFLRGVLRELAALGHEVLALEPEDAWSAANLLADRGPAALTRFARDFPELVVCRYGTDFDHEAVLQDASVVIVHEWNEPWLVSHLGRLRRQGGGFLLLFHDTHHRGVSDRSSIDRLALADYDAVLAFGETLRERYLEAGWGRRVFTWHEAADTRLFRPGTPDGRPNELIWIGNWGDGERAAELEHFLIEPARRLGLGGVVHGVRYPAAALDSLATTRLTYGGSIANADAPAAFARHRMTVHVPRRPYVEALPGIPTIRMFEALACGIPLVSAPWHDSEGLFRRGTDYLVARNTDEMTARLLALRDDPAMARDVATRGLETVRARHTCGHRARELLDIVIACTAAAA